MIRCEKCGSQVPRANSTCEYCGHKNSFLVPCEACSSQMSKDAPYCPSCAHPNPLTTVDGGVKSKIVAGLLAIFLGTFGIHKFYLNQAKMGLLYLVFFWSFIPTLVGFIEGLIYLLQSDERFRERRRKAQR
jgi:TM2 domain-containing membrane protein YozV